MKGFKILAIFGFVAALGACQKEYEVETIPGSNMAEEWYVQGYFGTADPANLIVPHFKILTSTTAAANGNELWINDRGNFWDFQVKSPANSGSLTFSGDSLVSVVDGYGIKVNIMNGKVYPNAGRSQTGRVTDSIYFEAQFEDDPGNTYVLAGHVRTGFLEDDY